MAPSTRQRPSSNAQTSDIWRSVLDLLPAILAPFFGIAAALLVVVRHKSNIRRLMAGTEPRFGEQADIRKE